MKKVLFILAVLFTVTFTSCENFMTRNFGGSQTIELQPGQKLVNVTWKKNQVWILTETRLDSIKPKTYKFKEKSNMGVMEGEITLVEK